jgi:dynactin 1
MCLLANWCMFFQPYLPQIYVESDSDATSCYLFFCRLGYKADLINSVVAQTHNLPDSLNGDVSETLVGVCEVSNHTELFYFPCKENLIFPNYLSTDAESNFWRVYAMQAVCSCPSAL